MSAWASWLLNTVQIVHFMPFYAQNYAQNYALIMQNYALAIMLYAQLCKRALLMHRTMTNYAHYVTSYAIICPNYAQLCSIMLKLCPKLCIIMLELYSRTLEMDEKCRFSRNLFLAPRASSSQCGPMYICIHIMHIICT